MTLLPELYAFWVGHRRCGDLDSAVVWRDDSLAADRQRPSWKPSQNQTLQVLTANREKASVRLSMV
jgi:hypothetical protein